MADEPQGNDAARERAIESLARKQSFVHTAITFGITFGVLVAIWAITGAGYFWPVWAGLGMGIALAYKAWAAYGTSFGAPTDEQIEREIRRQQGR